MIPVIFMFWTIYESINVENSIKRKKDETLATFKISLEQKNWRKADILTRVLLRNSYLDNPRTQSSCEDIYLINKAWIESSNGRFGLTVQKYLWQKSLAQAIASKKWFFDDENSHALLLFGEIVGWRSKKEHRWLRYDEIVFEAPLEQFPIGYFPVSWGEIDEHNWDMLALSKVLNKCGIR
jgi:GUN4-like